MIYCQHLLVRKSILLIAYCWFTDTFNGPTHYLPVMVEGQRRLLYRLEISGGLGFDGIQLGFC